MSTAILIAAAACIVVCYISACHIALKRYSRARLADLLEARDQSLRLAGLADRQHAYILITGVLRASLNMIVLLAVFYHLQNDTWPNDPWWDYPIAFLIAAALVSVFAVAIPTSWAGYHAESLIVYSLPVLHVLHLIFRPLALLHVFDPVVRRITGVDLSEKDDSELSDEVLSVVEDSDQAGDIDDAQKQMLEAVFDLPSTDAGEVMTPRTEVKGIDVASSLPQVKQAILEFGHSRIPVYEESLDNVIGILYAKDLIRYVGEGEAFDLRAALREPFLVPESKKLHELLAEFKAKKVHLAIVLDEYGGTAGLVTIEDLLEEIVGDIQDEYEETETEPGISLINNATAEVDARVRIDDLNDELDLELPEDEDYDTVGGFVFSTLGHIPEPGEDFEYEQCRFTVTEAERTKVTRVRVEKLETQSAQTD